MLPILHGAAPKLRRCVADVLRMLWPVQAREWYRQDLVGAAVAASGIPRNQLFITSKLHPRTHGYWSTLQARAFCEGAKAGSWQALAMFRHFRSPCRHTRARHAA